MSSEAVTAAGSVTGNSEQTKSKAADNSVLGKDAFLKILVTQLANQDPLEPLDQSEFISQMAQFTQVEQISNMEDVVQSLGQYMKFSSSSLIGSNVTYSDPESGEEGSAKVESVVFEADNVKIKMDNGLDIPLSRVIGVKE